MFFLVFSDNFDLLISKIKKDLKKIILMHFQAKSTFKKHPTPQYQTRTKWRLEICNKWPKKKTTCGKDLNKLYN